MNRKPPSLRKHATGQYMVKWGGKPHYLGTDPVKANERYLSSLRDWAAWRAERDSLIRLPKLRTVPSVVELSKLFLDAKEAERGPVMRTYYTNHLKRFVGIYRNARSDQIRVAALVALKTDMLRAGYHPRNIQHDLGAVKTMFRWAVGMEIIPLVDLSFCKAPEAEPVQDKAYTEAQAWGFIGFVPAPMRAWLTVQYLGFMRPSEVVRLVHRQGEFEEPWLFRMRSKVQARTKEPRRVVLSDAALSFLGECEPRWTRIDTYYQAVYRVVFGTAWQGYAPHPLRHSAATCLQARGVDRQHIDLLLGHLPPRVSRIYARIDWATLREPASRIAKCTVESKRP